MPYRYLEELSSADAAFEATGRTLEELFSDAAIATFEVMADTNTVKQLLTREIELENESVDGLLIDWLSELVFLKDTENILFSVFDVNIRKNDVYLLKAAVKGEKIDREKHSLRSDVKAVTYHMFEVTKKGDNWTARVVLDI
ncbi:MAG: archease [Candidatus Methanoperedens sp.]|nr:archease [Candidatus Methanoperedens sp.]